MKRFQQFRQEYLDTPEGRQHRQNELQEQKDVQIIFERLRAEQRQGVDMTDEVLQHLLPYADTEGNRTRGNRVSTWPCITKDIRTWFEGIKWKTASEWPDTAKWLLDIAEAGQREDWPQWRVLANQPIRKGFACGFITPITHCLNPSLPVINSKVVATYKQVAQELGIKDLFEWDIYCHWNISKKLGGKDTQHTTENPVLFEQAVTKAFRALGFQAEHIGGSGDTDVDVHALLGDQSYSLVIDAKTSQLGRPRGNINYDPLKSHQEQHAADYAIVVAPAFAGGDTVAFAEKQGIGLLETELLIQLVEESERSGLSLYLLRDIFSKVGLLRLNLAAQSQSRNDMMQAMIAVLEVFEMHQRGEETSPSLEVGAVYWMLKGKGSKFPKHSIEHAIDLLANPLVGVLEKKGESYILMLPARKAFARFTSLNEVLKTNSTDPSLD